MALIRNIGNIDQQMSDLLSPTDMLLNAYNNTDGAVQAAPPLSIPVTQVNTVYPPSGGNVDGAPPSGGGTANIAVVTADATVIPVLTPDSNPAVDTGSPAGGTPASHSNTSWVLLALGIGAVYLATRKGKAVSGIKKKSLVIPAVIVGGVGLWWYMSKKGSAATSTSTGTADAARQWLLTQYQASNAPNEASLKAAVPLMSDAEAVAFKSVLSYTMQPGFNGVLPADMQSTFNTIMSKYGIPGL